MKEYLAAVAATAATGHATEYSYRAHVEGLFHCLFPTLNITNKPRRQKCSAPIGSYQPAQKWLKDRQGRALTFDEVRHYQRLLAALEGTERLMREWDAEEGSEK